MSAKTGQVVTPLFTTSNPADGSAVNADALPTGTLYLNGTANGAAVTVTNLATGLYKAAVTMPTLAAGDRVSLTIAATVGGVTGKGIIWGDFGETATASDVKTVADGIAAKTVNLPAAPAAVGSAMTLTSGERTSIASAVSSLATTGLAALKTLVDAVLLKTNTIGALTLTYTGTVDVTTGDVTLCAGDDYLIADSRGIPFDVTDPTHALGLDDPAASVTFKATQVAWEAALIASTVAGYHVEFEATRVQTAPLRGTQDYEIECVTADGSVETRGAGTLRITRDIPVAP